MNAKEIARSFANRLKRPLNVSLHLGVLAALLAWSLPTVTLRAAEIPANKVNDTLWGFILSGAYDNTGGSPQGAGSFANGAMKSYPEGSCMPYLVQMTNKDSVAGDISFSPNYDYYNSVVGIADVEQLTTGLAGSALKSGADNLNDFTFTGNSISAITSFSTESDGSVSAAISGPYAGDDTGTTAVSSTDSFRHYNITLQNVPAGETVNVLFCARLGVDASEYNGASLSARLSGGKENSAISVNQVLVLPSITISKTVASGSASPEDFSFTVSGLGTYSIASGNSITIDNVSPDGTYTITESGPSGYEFLSGTGTNCSFDTSGLATATVAAAKNPTNAVCEFTNAESYVPAGNLTVTKVIVDDSGLGTAQVADFSLHVGQTTVTSGETNSFAPGSYAVSESGGPSGYSASFSGDCDSQGNVTVTDGGNASCVITNTFTNYGSLTIVKQVVNSQEPASSFQLYLDSQPVASGTTVDLLPGSYAVSEDNLPNFIASYSADCANGQVSLAAGDDLTCTITNTYVEPEPDQGVLTVVKVVENNGLGTAQPSDFDLYVNQTAVTTGVAQAFNVGGYTVSESGGPSGYSASFSGDCDSQGNVNIEADGIYECVITNTFTDYGSLTVTKVVENLDMGTALVTDFTLYVSQATVVSGETNDFLAGSYSLSESGPSGYEASFSGDCDSQGLVTIGAGDSLSCTITNTFSDYGYLTVVKQVENSEEPVSSFHLYVDGTPISSGETVVLPAGEYVVSEDNLPNFTASFSQSCPEGAVSLNAGDEIVCAITNTYVEPPPQTASVMITKVVENGELGTAAVGDFGLYVGQTQVTSGETNQFSPGTYQVSESGPSGYSASFSGDCDSQGGLTVTAGETYTCTITNTFTDYASLTVTKVVVNDDEGTAEVSDYTLYVDETVVASGVSNVFLPGSYWISESGPEGYSASFSGDCDSQGGLTMEAGGQYSCTITNDDIAPDPDTAWLTVVLNIINNNGGTATESDFTLMVGSGTVSSGDSHEYLTGSYTVSVTAPSGYTYFFGQDCDTSGNVSLGVDEEKTCLVTADDVPPPPGGGGGQILTGYLTVVTHIINDDGGILLPAQVTMTVSDGAVVHSVFGGIDSPGITLGVNPGQVTVTGTDAEGYSKTASASCNTSVAAGQYLTCVFTYNDNPPPAPPQPPAPPAPPQPEPMVLGAVDEEPEPEVLGAVDEELPRTGAATGYLLLPLVGLLAGLRRRRS